MRTERERALDALNRLREEKISLTEAARLNGLTLEEVKEHIRPAIRKVRGRWRAQPWDRLEREMRFIDRKGLTVVTVRDSRTAKRVGRYFAAVEHYLETGDWSPLKEFRGRTFQSFGVIYPFITNPTLLKRLGKAGELSFENIYATVGGQS